MIIIIMRDNIVWSMLFLEIIPTVGWSSMGSPIYMFARRRVINKMFIDSTEQISTSFK